MSWLGFHFGQLQQDPLSNRINFGQNKLNILPNSKEAIKISQRVVKFNQSGDFFKSGHTDYWHDSSYNKNESH